MHAVQAAWTYANFSVYHAPISLYIRWMFHQQQRVYSLDDLVVDDMQRGEPSILDG